MGCYSNNIALRKKVYYLFSVYSLHRCENSSVYRMHNTSILSVAGKTKVPKVKISVFGGWSWMWWHEICVVMPCYVIGGTNVWD